jgi:hypothetical protein
MVRSSSIALAATLLLALVAVDAAKQKAKVTHKVFFDIEIAGVAAGRITMGLFGDAGTAELALFPCSRVSLRAGR